ncbi:DUF5372 family protein [Rhizobium beringeri]
MVNAFAADRGCHRLVGSPQWTDLVSPDPEVAMSNGRSLLRVADLMELTALVERLSSKSGTRRRARM